MKKLKLKHLTNLPLLLFPTQAIYISIYLIIITVTHKATSSFVGKIINSRLLIVKLDFG
jgi:hypothetical protein